VPQELTYREFVMVVMVTTMVVMVTTMTRSLEAPSEALRIAPSLIRQHRQGVCDGVHGSDGQVPFPVLILSFLEPFGL
jgi:hypothetical protein